MKGKKLFLSVLATTFILGAGYTSASAAEKTEEPTDSISPLGYVPCDAYIEPGSKVITTTGADVSRSLGWGGGPSSTYSVKYNDGLTTYNYGNKVNFYKTVYTQYYSLGGQTSKIWNTLLTVTNGNVAQANGKVHLSDK